MSTKGTTWTLPIKGRKDDGSLATIVDKDGNVDAPVTTTNATFTGNTTLGDNSSDTITANGTSTFNAPITVGADDTGHDVQLFGATSGAYFLWDESADTLSLAGTAKLTVAGLATFSGGVSETAQQRTPNNDSGPNSIINAGVTAVDVQAVTNDANDWIVLPSLSSVEIGHTIKIACNAGGNFELRTPASSNEKINGVDSDGTQEYLCTDTEIIFVTKVSDTDGWVATALTALGAVATAVVPD